MSQTATNMKQQKHDASVARVEMKLEVMIIPVSDVDRSKEFYERLGWSLDRDIAPMEGLRIVQFTPPGSGTSVTFGQGLTTAAPGSAEGELVVSDIEAAYDDLVGRGIEVSDIWHGPPFPVEARQPGPHPERTSYRSFSCFTDPDGQHVAGPGGHDAALVRSPAGETPLRRATRVVFVSTGTREGNYAIPLWVKPKGTEHREVSNFAALRSITDNCRRISRRARQHGVFVRRGHRCYDGSQTAAQ